MQQRKRVTEFLATRPDQKFTVRQIAEWFRETFPDDCEQKKSKSPQIKTESDLIKKLRAEIGTVLLRAEPPIQRTNEKPRKYYFSEKVGGKKEAPVAKSRADEHTTQPSLTEHDLYPLLWEYLKTELSVYSKRIDERKAKNNRKGDNHWRYPDLVGLEGLSDDWEPIIRDCAKEQGDKRTRLWSFEVKLELGTRTYREDFFQAVSNSAWANFGYLVAGQINDKDIMQELQILASLHGIGVIRLDREDPTKSELLIPAREKSEVDWTNANRLAKASKDFREFVDLVIDFHKTNKIRTSDWPRPLGR